MSRTLAPSAAGDASVAVHDLRGLAPSAAPAPVLHDPTGRRAQRIRAASRAVLGVLVLWFFSLTLAGLGLLPAGMIPLGGLVSAPAPKSLIAMTGGPTNAAAGRPGSSSPIGVALRIASGERLVIAGPPAPPSFRVGASHPGSVATDPLSAGGRALPGHTATAPGAGPVSPEVAAAPAPVSPVAPEPSAAGGPGSVNAPTAPSAPAPAARPETAATPGASATAPGRTGEQGASSNAGGSNNAPASSNAGGTRNAPASSNAGGNGAASSNAGGNGNAPASSNAGGSENAVANSGGGASANSSAGGNNGSGNAPASSNAGGSQSAAAGGNAGGNGNGAAKSSQGGKKAEAEAAAAHGPRG